MSMNYCLPYKKIILFLVLSTLVFGNTQVGKTQSETDWSNPVNVSRSGISKNPVAVVDLHGVIHVIWIDDVDGYRYSRSTDGIQWTTPIKVSFPFSIKDYTPYLLADENGSIHVFWLTERQELFYSQTTSDDFSNPSFWITSRLSRSAASFDVAIDAQGALHIAYIENITDERQKAGVYYRQSIIGGGFWSEARTLYNTEYFRATTDRNTSVKVAVADKPGKQKIYVSWDNRPQKHVYLATSENQGKSWTEAQPFRGPNDSGQFGTPFNFTIWAHEDDLLFMWQVGEPGASKCSVYSQASADEGVTWGSTTLLFNGPTACPTDIRFVFQQDNMVAAVLSGAGDSVLIAWDGLRWSPPQAQIVLPTVINPDTFDPIVLGCQQNIFYKGKLIVVGCDQSKGRDIWLLSRTLLPLTDWFNPLSVWNDPQVFEIEDQKASFLNSVTDSKGNIHVVWAQTAHTQDGSKPSIHYSRWDGNTWSTPESIIQNLDGEPLQLTMYLDRQDRLMLAWVNGASGDLHFTWSNLDQANTPSGWVASTVLPAPSQLISSPDIVVDVTGRIVVSYAIVVNEGRGVYLVQSTDNGTTWSPYLQAFNGETAEWDMVDAPKIALSGDGVLHLLFTREALRSGELFGLYYSQSKDGGVTWSDPQIVSDGQVSWSDIVVYGDQAVHRIWQENNGLVVANLSQESLDAGVTWSRVLDVTAVSEKVMPVALASNGTGGLAMLQLARDERTSNVNQDKLLLSDWHWDGAQWSAGAIKEIAIKGAGLNYLMTASLTSNNYVGVFLAVEYIDVKRELRSDVLNLIRFQEGVTASGTLPAGIIPAPFFAENNNPVDPASTAFAPTSSADPSILFDSNDPSEGNTKNLVGIGLIVVVGLVGVVLVIRGNLRSRIGRPK